MLVDSILVCLWLVSEQWGSFLNHLSCWWNSWTPTPDTDQGGKRPCGTRSLKLKWDSAKLKRTVSSQTDSELQRKTKKLKNNYDKRHFHSTYLNVLTILTLRLCLNEVLNNIFTSNCIANWEKKAKSSLESILTYICGHHFAAQSSERKIWQSPVVWYALNSDVVAWIQQQRKSVSSISMWNVECVLIHLLAVLLSASSLLSLSTQAHEHVQAWTHSHVPTQTHSHPHDHREQHYHNLGN